MVWENEPENVQKPIKSLHVWMVNLDANKSMAPELTKMLSVDEKEKAARFYFEKDQLRYIVARATLRLLLGRYLKRQPQMLQFGYTEFGKPFLSGHGLSSILSFNVSHSSQLALFAFSSCSELGVDIEEQRGDLATLDLAKRFFFGTEIDALKSCRKEDFNACFFNCWTRKEAYMKAKGLGLSLPLDSFAVEAHIDSMPKLLVSRHYPDDAKCYSIIAFEPAACCSAAIAVNSSFEKPRFIKLETSSLLEGEER